MKEFWKLVKTGWNHCHKRVARFLGRTVYVCHF